MDKRIATFLVICALALTCTSDMKAICKGKTWTIADRQQQLMQEINKAQKEKELTVKEANKLRQELAKVARRKTKFKAADQNLDNDQKKKLESDLNDISVKIKKLQLEKRVNAN